MKNQVSKSTKTAWPHTQAFLEHIFGEQAFLFEDYLSIQLQRVFHRLPVIIIAGQRASGKTTFCLWLEENFSCKLIRENGELIPEELVTKKISCIDEACDVSDKDFMDTICRFVRTQRINYRRKKYQDNESDLYSNFILTTSGPLGCQKSNFPPIWLVFPSQIEKPAEDILKKLKEEIGAYKAYLLNRDIRTPNSGPCWFEPSLFFIITILATN